MEVQGIYILQNCSDTLCRHPLANVARQMVRGKVRLAEEYNQQRIWMRRPRPRHSIGSMTIALGNATHIAPRRAIRSVYGNLQCASDLERVQKRLPLVSPIHIEAEALAQLGVGSRFCLPFVYDVLVTGEYRFEQQDKRTLLGLTQILEHVAQEELA